MDVCECADGFLYHSHSLGISTDHSATVRLAALRHYSGELMYMVCSYRGLSVRPVLTEVCLYCQF